jgi:hypothetical protein
MVNVAGQLRASARSFMEGGGADVKRIAIGFGIGYGLPYAVYAGSLIILGWLMDDKAFADPYDD